MKDVIAYLVTRTHVHTRQTHYLLTIDGEGPPITFSIDVYARDYSFDPTLNVKAVCLRPLHGIISEQPYRMCDVPALLSMCNCTTSDISVTTSSFSFLFVVPGYTSKRAYWCQCIEGCYPSNSLLMHI